jgi:hypothetical protein
MRYAAMYKPDSEPLDQFIKSRGGINACAAAPAGSLRAARGSGRHQHWGLKDSSSGDRRDSSTPISGRHGRRLVSPLWATSGLPRCKKGRGKLPPSEMQPVPMHLRAR